MSTTQQRDAIVPDVGEALERIAGLNVSVLSNLHTSIHRSFHWNFTQ